jgi:hypothetical protein
MIGDGLDGVRDSVLAIARDVVRTCSRRADDPAVVAALLRAACGVEIRVEDDFSADPVSGVEALGFVVASGSLGAVGGLILRLPGELPDSFEPVPALDGRDPGAARRQFFAGPHPPLSGPRTRSRP